MVSPWPGPLTYYELLAKGANDQKRLEEEKVGNLRSLSSPW